MFFKIVLFVFVLISQTVLFAEELSSKSEKLMWKSAWELFFSQKSCVFYDLIVSDNPETSLSFVPSAAQIRQTSKQNPNGYDTGMEDGMILAGVVMSAVLDKYELTQDKSLKVFADKILEGIHKCTIGHPNGGFVARAVSVDGEFAFYPSTSRDQYTHCLHALWRYFKSPLCGVSGKRLIAQIAKAVADRMFEKVTAANGFDALNFDGSTSTNGLSKMWNVAPHEAARLPMIYAVAWGIIGDEKYRNEYERYLEPALKQSEHFVQMAPWAQLQMQISLEVLRDFAETQVQRRRIEKVMERVSQLASKRLREARIQMEKSGEALYVVLPNPQLRPFAKRGTPDMAEFAPTLRPPRYFAEMGLTLLADGAPRLSKDDAECMADVLNTLDYSRIRGCGLLFHLSLYWNIKKSGL